ncbi:MAG: 2-oxo acid dehydrogenase subunit E2 [Chloroflexi bacterium]|nr:2-oxo acid dehydrogenase subunit E2 [Chloroflexota bacterium]
MAETVIMPKLGFDMAEGVLVRWVVSEGETVEKGAVLAEIETDKATVEVESNFSGVLHRHLVPEGEVVPVGQPIAIIGEPGEEIKDVPSTEEVSAAAEDAGPGAFTAGEIAGGEGGEKLDVGVAGDVKYKEGQEPQEAEAGATDTDGRLPGGVRASPVARRLAMEKNINLSQVKGSGPQGRVTKRDIEAFLQQVETAAPAAPAAAPAAPAPETKAVPLPAFSPVGPPPPDETIKVSRLRAAIGRRMVESKQQVPHFYVTHEYRMDALMDLRKQVNAMLPDDEKLSVNDFLVKATALALRQFPNLNAALKGDELIRFGQVNIGVAVAVEGGLLTVVCRDADRKPLRQISLEVKSMAGRAREGKVRPEEIEGSTFSISNLGMFDVEHFVAIINPPEAAILAVGSAAQVPVVENGEIKIGWRMKATLSVDHRVSDGAEGARFLQALAAYIEEPMRLLL